MLTCDTFIDLHGLKPELFGFAMQESSDFKIPLVSQVSDYRN
jgi:hypothetical protein